jgi:ABC-type Mn2+/Zn2+ transport system permease subunit
MKFVKAIAILWGMVYVVVGLLKAFTLNSVDFWASIVLLLSLFLLPLPLAIAAIWLQKSAGFALLACVAVGLVAAGVVAVTRPSASQSDKVISLLLSRCG